MIIIMPLSLRLTLSFVSEDMFISQSVLQIIEREETKKVPKKTRKESTGKRRLAIVYTNTSATVKRIHSEVFGPTGIANLTDNHAHCM